VDEFFQQQQHAAGQPGAFEFDQMRGELEALPMMPPDAADWTQEFQAFAPQPAGVLDPAEQAAFDQAFSAYEARPGKSNTGHICL
jgi:hypothetical protein